ncbi:DinB family protein [Nocardia sp. NPDC051832]|uniref:DinB family protein n=1 Tax=Nocardia sp. NPDC051832 TaxID=3155673 RepID=UPI0034234923
MTSAELLIDAFGRVPKNVHGAVADLSTDELSTPLEPGANSIAWLLRHLTRVQDDHIADVAGLAQVWTAAGWAKRFDLPFDDAATGHGHNTADIGALTDLPADLLLGYRDVRQCSVLQGGGGGVRGRAGRPERVL